MKQILIALMTFTIVNVASAQNHKQTFYDYGKTRIREDYYTNASGQKNGLYREYDEKGVVFREYNYTNGVQEGLSTDYSFAANGKRVVSVKATFRKGVLDGPIVGYCERNNFESKLQEGSYKQGQKTGPWKEWWCDEERTDAPKRNGKYAIKVKCEYLHDDLDGTWVLYADNDSGKVVGGGKYHRGTRVGEWIILFNNSNTETKLKSAARSKLTVKLDSTGKPTGPGTVYDFKNKIRIEVEEVTSLNPMSYNGKCTWYYENGNKSEEATFANGYRHGEVVGYYENGKLNYKQQYSAGRRTGHWEVYFDSGKLQEEFEWDNTGNNTLYDRCYDESGTVIPCKQ